MAVVVVAVPLLPMAQRHLLHGQQHFFDDSLMFYRYAWNMRHGLGISWNPDGVHTYGCTSMTWLFVIWVMTFLGAGPALTVQLASLLTYIAFLSVAVVWMQRTAQAPWFRSPGICLMMGALPLELNTKFQQLIFTGMDTMLSLLCHLAIAATALRFARHPTRANAVIAGVVGFLACETRPESLICALMVPILLWWWLDSGRRAMNIAIFLGVEAGLLAIATLLARWYFHVPVPLAFYLKMRHGYVGFVGYDGPAEFLAIFAGYLLPYAAVILLLVRKATLRIVLALGIPALLTTMYLCTVTQIMGYSARYFAPLIAYPMVLAWLLINREVAADEKLAIRKIGGRACVAVLLLIAFACNGDIVDFGRTLWVKRTHHPVPQPALTIAATAPLPQLGAVPVMPVMTGDLLDAIPAGGVVAATEVGYPGAYAPQLVVIDMAGLNDNEFALQPFSAEALLARRPDVIWLPHGHYTGMRAALLADPDLLREYDVYDQVLDYGVALRKEGPYSAIANGALQQLWKKHYPGFRPEDYRVQSVASPATK